MTRGPIPTEGLSLDQAPPLSVPASFFLLAPVAMAAAGAVMLVEPAALTQSRHLPATVAALHLGTLGFLAAVMLGALYQMIPVVAGAPVPGVRAAHGVHVGLALAVAALAAAFASGATPLYWVALQLIVLTALVFIAPVAVALVRAPTRNDTVTGMKIAVTGLAGVVTLGVTLAAGRASGLFMGDWDAWLAAHVIVGLIVWVGGLLTSVSWQLLPMFYLTEPLPCWSRRLTLASVALSGLAAPVAAAAGAGREVVLLCGVPGAVTVWLLQPLLAFRALRHRRRRRADDSLRFWWLAVVAAPLALAAAFAAWRDDTGLGWSLAFGWLAVWGWAGAVVHGMLTRIVPFLVWFHRYSHLVGLVPLPPMKRLWPPRQVRVGLLLHAAAVAVGAAAAALGHPLLSRLAGGLLVATAVSLAIGLVGVLRRRPTPAQVRAAREAQARLDALMAPPSA